MSLTRPIPAAAMPVIRILRKEVARPRGLPHLCSPSAIRWLRWTRRKRKQTVLCCPMGMHPKATIGTPSSMGTFLPKSYRRTTNKAVDSMANWWDEQTDAQAATDAVWPISERKRG